MLSREFALSCDKASSHGDMDMGGGGRDFDENFCKSQTH